jgi:hypothetical protein
MDYVIFLLNYIEIVRISSALTPNFPIYTLKHFPIKFVQDCCFYPFILIAMCFKAGSEWKSSKVEEDVMGLAEMIVKGFVYLIGQKVCWIYE